MFNRYCLAILFSLGMLTNMQSGCLDRLKGCLDKKKHVGVLHIKCPSEEHDSFDDWTASNNDTSLVTSFRRSLYSVEHFQATQKTLRILCKSSQKILNLGYDAFVQNMSNKETGIYCCLCKKGIKNNTYWDLVTKENANLSLQQRVYGDCCFGRQLMFQTRTNKKSLTSVMLIMAINDQGLAIPRTFFLEDAVAVYAREDVQLRVDQFSKKFQNPNNLIQFELFQILINQKKTTAVLDRFNVRGDVVLRHLYI